MRRTRGHSGASAQKTNASHRLTGEMCGQRRRCDKVSGLKRHLKTSCHGKSVPCTNSVQFSLMVLGLPASSISYMPSWVNMTGLCRHSGKFYPGFQSVVIKIICRYCMCVCARVHTYPCTRDCIHACMKGRGQPQVLIPRLGIFVKVRTPCF